MCVGERCARVGVGERCARVGVGERLKGVPGWVWVKGVPGWVSVEGHILRGAQNAARKIKNLFKEREGHTCMFKVRVLIIHSQLHT